ncbi:MAG: hypothetical protein COA54_04305 [Thiotrichaceae bacterium]|nr:MAG: hypothetical protein COA54_04305 [Thiotrichaceae bacterium]
MSTVTGNAATDCTTMLQGVANKYFSPRTVATGGGDAIAWTNGPDPESNVIVDDEELKQKMLASKSAKGAFGGGVSFADLWNRNVSALSERWEPNESDVNGEYDQSSADAALVQHLAFWTGKDCARIERLMWQSGLVRDKWKKHKTYLRNTILNAVAQCKSVYGQSVKTVENTKSIDELLTEEKSFIPIEKLSIKSMPGFTGDHLTDATILLSATFDYRLVNMDGVLYYFDGQKFVVINDKTIRRCIGKAMGYGDVKVTQNRITGTLAVLKDQAPEIGEANPQSRNVYFKDCVLNPETGEVSHHKIENRNTSTLTVDYESNATCLQFDKFLNSIYLNDPEQIRLLQEVIGWILICDYLGIEKAVLFIGPPRAGKGVIARIIFALLDSGAIPFSLSELDDNKRLSGMRHARVAIDSDAVGAGQRNARYVMGLFKIITSNEKLSVPQLYAQVPWTGSLNCKLFVMANSIPTMWDDSTATGNRWIPVMFSQSFLGRENPKLYKTLVTELPGIAVWAVEGLKRLITRGYFELPPSSRDQLDSLVSDGGSTQDFINDRLVLGERERVTSHIMWDVYRQWAISTGHEIGKRNHILKSLEDALRGHGVRRSKSVRMNDGKDHRGFYGVAVNTVTASGQVIPFPPS